MRYKYLLITFLFLCANAHAEWFLRGTHNDWAAAQMESEGAGTNTVQLKGVVFTAAGNIKFDRFGNWSENYGVGGRSGSNIPVAAGTWDIKFFTDTKNWNISAAQTSSSSFASSLAMLSSSKSSLANSSAISSAPASIYHLRGTFNSWLEGTLLNRIGNTDNYEYCVNFVAGDANGGPRFKIDPNGAWGDAFPAADFVVSAGWVKITLNSTSKAISVQQNLPANCVTASSSVAATSSMKSSAISSTAASSAPASIYHLRGTFNSWLEGTLLNRVGNTDNYDYCVNFVAGDANGGPRFKIDPNGAWGDAIPAADFVVSAGWVKINFNSISKAISVQQNLAANCGAASSSAISSVVTSSSKASVNSSLTPSSSSALSSSAISSAPASIYHLRGTFNSWQEGVLLNRVGNTDNYDYCVNFVAGDANGGPRFKIDPNGAWGDAIPAADFVVSIGWVKINFNSTSKAISVQQNLPANCATASSSVAVSSSVKSSAISSTAVSSAPASIYHLRGTFNSWQEGTLLNRVGNTDNYDYCVNFVAGDANGGPRFKIDPNGAWGDAFPSADFVVAAGWVKITLNSISKAISVQQNLPANCAVSSSAASVNSSAASSAPASIYHLRGTFNSWLEGTLLTRVGNTDNYDYCVNFVAGDANGGPRFKIDPNGAWGDAIPAADFVVSAGWVKITFTSTSKAISVQQNLPANCTAAASSLLTAASASPVSLVNPVNISLDSAHHRALVIDSSNSWGVVAVDLTTGARSLLTNLLTPNSVNPLNQPFGIAIDYPRNRALVADIQDDAVIAVDLTSGARTLLTAKHTLGTPRDLVIDTDRNRALVVDESLAAVVAIDLTSGVKSILSSIPSNPNAPDSFNMPSGIALDKVRNRVLVADFGRDAVIAVDLTSGARSILSNNSTANAATTLARPVGIALDAAHNRALVTTPGASVVTAVDLITGARTEFSSHKLQGAAVPVDALRGIVVDSAGNRALATDVNIGAVVAIDLETGVRTYLSK